MMHLITYGSALQLEHACAGVILLMRRLMEAQRGAGMLSEAEATCRYHPNSAALSFYQLHEHAIKPSYLGLALPLHTVTEAPPGQLWSTNKVTSFHL